jgi:hypothetical protein
MTPFEVLQWIGVGFTGVVALALGIVAVKSAIKPSDKPLGKDLSGIDPHDMGVKKEDQ